MKTLAISNIALAGALGACSTTPENNASLESTRTAIMQIRSDPQVVENAPVALDRAVTTLGAAEQAWRDSPGDERVDHLAYLARQRAATARELAGLKSAEQSVNRRAQTATGCCWKRARGKPSWPCWQPTAPARWPSSNAKWP